MTFSCTCSYIFLIFTSLHYPLGLSPTSHWYPTSSRVPLLFPRHSWALQRLYQFIVLPPVHKAFAPHPPLLLLFISLMVLLLSKAGSHDVLSICVSTRAKNIELLFKYLSGIFVSFFENYLFNSVSFYWLGDLCFAIKLFEFFVYTGC